MRKALIRIILCFVTCTRTLAMAAPHEEGIAAGNAANPDIRSAINQASAATAVPGYTATPAQTAYYGQPNLSSQATAHLLSCALAPNDPVCEAQRGAVASANTARPAVTADDPDVATAKAMARNPALALGSLASYYAGCVTNDVSTPAAMRPRLCHRYVGVGNFPCSRTLTVGLERTTSCHAGDWFSQADSGDHGFDVLCLPDRPDTAQHFRVTAMGNVLAYFDADVSAPRVFPQAIVDLGLAATSPWSPASAAHNRVWIVDNACTASTCAVTALIAPDYAILCTGGDAANCSLAEPFNKIYAACPDGQLSGGSIALSSRPCDGCEPALSTLDDAQCYAPSASPTAYTGVSVTAPASTNWTPVAPRPVIGWQVNPAFPLAIPRMSLQYTKPATRFTETDRWDDQCPVLAAGSRCTLASADVCVDGPATKNIDGKDVTRPCWQYNRTFSCASGAPVDECASLAASGCSPTASTCRQMNAATGACEVFEETYHCPVPAQTTTTASNCPNDVFCLGASCFNKAYPNDTDFARSMSYLEAAREAGVYLDADRMHVFKGERNHCRDRLLQNCCYSDSHGAGMSNQSLLGAGSRLVYDILMNADNREFITQGLHALLASGGFNGSLTTYGVTVAVNGTALPAGSMTLATTDSLAIAFDPWSLSVSVVFYVAMSMMSCNEEEGKLAMKEGAHLCHTVGNWCSSCITVFGSCISCIEHTTSKCCFNSVLSRIVNEQGRAQIGKSWGSAENPDCSGFTVAQLQALDFGAMDLTEFYAAIVPSMPNVGHLQSTNAARLSNCYYGKGKCQ